MRGGAAGYAPQQQCLRYFVLPYTATEVKDMRSAMAAL